MRRIKGKAAEAKEVAFKSSFPQWLYYNCRCTGLIDPVLCNQLPNACPTKTGLESCSSRACAIHLQLHSDSLQKAGASLEGNIHSAAAKALGDSKRCQVGVWRIILAA